MDLFSEGSSGGRVLIARHVSADKALRVPQQAVNTSALCHSLNLPDVNTYFSGLQFYGSVLLACGGIAVLATVVFFFITLRASMKHRPRLISQVVAILAVYPVLSAMALIALLVPRARLLSESVSQQAVMVAMYQLYLFIIGDCGGPDQLLRRAEGARLETRVLPCCCWPCCVIPRPMLHKKRLFMLRMLVLQMPIVQAILYIFILVLWAEDPMLYNNSFMYFQPLIATSILTGVWGMVMTVRAGESAGIRPRGKLLALQSALLIVKVQGGTLKFLPNLFTLPCHPPLTPTVYVHLIHNSLMILQMLLLSIWAWRLYSAAPSKMVEKIRHVKVVAILDDSKIPPILTTKKDGVVNKCFTIEHQIDNY